MIGNTTLPKNMMDDHQCWGDPTIQHFRLDDSSKSNQESVEGIYPGVPHVRNQVTLNDIIICVGDGSHVGIDCMVQVTTHLYYKYLEIYVIDLKNEY